MTSDMDFKALSDDLFHAFDIRIDSALLTDDVQSRLIHAQALYFDQVIGTRKLVLCRDDRLTSPHLLQFSADMFCRLGFEVHLCLLPVTTCRFYFSCFSRDDCCGIMFTASHNPGYYTGQKIVIPSCLPIASGVGPQGGLDAIRNRFMEGSQHEEKKGSLFVFNDLDAYVQYWMNLTGLQDNSLKEIHVLADFLSGCAGEEIALALQKTGVDLTVRNVVPDGHFPCGAPNPVVLQNIQPTLDVLEEGRDKYDFCFCFDGDGDRMEVLTGDGKSITPSIVFAFLTPFLLSHFKYEGIPSIGLDSKASPIAYKEIEKAGAHPFLIPNGHSTIKSLILKDKMIGAVEDTAHYYFRLPHGIDFVPMESTLFVCLSFLSQWNKNKKSFTDLLDEQRKVFTEREWGKEYKDQSQKVLVLSTIEKFFEAKGYETTKTLEDGSPLGAVLMKKSLKDGGWCWISQRASESEKGMARWMVNSSSIEELRFTVKEIKLITEAR